MAHKIITEVYDNVGNTYLTDVHVSYQSMDVDLSQLDSLMVRGRLTFHKTLADKEAGFAQLQPILSLTDKTPTNMWSKQLTEQEAGLVSPSVIAGYVFDYLESMYGEGNVVVV